MDPITLIINALVAGASAATKDTVGQAVMDAYDGLKSLIQRRFADKPEAAMALTRHEEKPKVWEEPLKDALLSTGADQDKDIIAAAQRLMKHIDPQQTAKGKYNVQIGGNVQGFVQGDNANVTMTFGNGSTEK